MEQGSKCQNRIALRRPPLELRLQKETATVGTEIVTRQTSPLAPISPRNDSRKYHAVATAPADPVPLFSSTAQSTPSDNRLQGISQTLAVALEEKNPFTRLRYTGGKLLQARGKRYDVDLEYLVRMEIYYRGFCPFCCRAFDRDSLPLNCPYVDCKADLRLCRKYPNRSNALRAPPRLAERGFLDTNINTNDRIMAEEASWELTRCRSPPPLTVKTRISDDEERQPANPQDASFFLPGFRLRPKFRPPPGEDNKGVAQTKPPSSMTKRLVDLEEPFPPPSTPSSHPGNQGNPAPSPLAWHQPTALSLSIKTRHRQLYEQHHHHHHQPHIAFQMRTPILLSSFSTAKCTSPPSPDPPSCIGSAGDSDNSADDNHISTSPSRIVKQEQPLFAPSPSPSYGRSTPLAVSLRARMCQQQWEGKPHHQRQGPVALQQTEKERRRKAHVSGRPQGLDLLKTLGSGSHARSENVGGRSNDKAENAERIMEIVRIYQEEEGLEENGYKDGAVKRWCGEYWI